MSESIQRLNTESRQAAAYEAWLALYKAWLKTKDENLPEVI